MHPVTRLGRVVQQLRSFGDLHASELERLAAELDSDELAAKVRAFAALQRDEGQLVVDELADVQAELSAAATPAETEPEQQPPAQSWRDSPKRAQWLAE